MLHMPRCVFSVLLATSVMMAAPRLAWAQAGVYLGLATTATMPFESVLDSVRAAARGAGWRLLADYETGVSQKLCSYRARVLIADWPQYTRVALGSGTHGAFAAQVRLAIFSDENGVHVVAVNPVSIQRTVVAEAGRDAEFASLARGLAAAVHAKVPGEVFEYGQVRERGRIGRTMGVMAGGPFEEKIEAVATTSLRDGDLQAFAEQLYRRLETQSATGEWLVRPVFLQVINETTAVIGLTSKSVEARSFDIVGAGASKNRHAMRCAGIDHAPAYPIELVLVKDDNKVTLQIIDEMYRMKMYFEDAGKVAFAKNMGMPGSIEAEVRRKVTKGIQP